MGLKVNLSKSEIVLVGSVAVVEGLPLMLGGKVGLLPLTYLGLPLGAKGKVSVEWYH